jgi:hypothetical protein
VFLREAQFRRQVLAHHIAVQSVTGRPPISISLTISALAMVDLPLPERPVKNTVKPCLARAAAGAAQFVTTSGKLNHSGCPALRAGGGAVRCRKCQHGLAFGHFVHREILGLFLHIDHLLEIDHLDADLGLCWRTSSCAA